MPTRTHIIILGLILCLGVIIRLQNFNLPPIDAHPMRQTDTECVAYNFAFKDANIFHPQACLIRPLDNPNGYFFLEFPLYQYVMGITYKLVGPSIVAFRLYNLVLYAVAGLSLYYFMSRFHSRKLAMISTFLFSFAPGSIFFIGHAIHPDVFATTTTLLSLALLMHFFHRRALWIFFASVLLLSMSVATRPFGLLVLPAYLYLLYRQGTKLWQYPVAILGSGALYGIWKLYQSQYPPELFDWETWILWGQERLLDPAIFIHHLILKNIVGEVVGKVITLFAAVGFVTSLFHKNHVGKFAILWLAGVPLYWYVAPNGNITHQYYANVFLIPILILGAYGVNTLTSLLPSKKLQIASLSLILALVTYNGYRTSAYYFNDLQSSDYLHIAREIQTYVPQDQRVVYLANLNSIPFSLAHRQGWMLGGGGVDVGSTAEKVFAMRDRAIYIVAGHNNTDLNEQELETIANHSTLVVKNDWVTIYKLN